MIDLGVTTYYPLVPGPDGTQVAHTPWYMYLFIDDNNPHWSRIRSYSRLDLMLNEQGQPMVFGADDMKALKAEITSKQKSNNNQESNYNQEQFEQGRSFMPTDGPQKDLEGVISGAPTNRGVPVKFKIFGEEITKLVDLEYIPPIKPGNS